eukprot:9206686-Pyramimonas_sp.AAC.1
MELHRRPQLHSHASPPSRAAFRCPTGRSTESPSGAVRMPLHPPRKAFRGPIGSSTEGNSCCTHMRLPYPGQPSAAHGDPHRLRYSQRRYSPLPMVGSFAR